jgi:hypothetical protein
MAAVPVAAAAMAASVEPQRFDLPDGLVLVGMDLHRLDDLFGQPEMVMSAGQAHWWRYAMGGCSIEMFLMPGASGDLLVSHVAVRPLPDLPVQRAESCRKLDASLAPAAEASLDLPAVLIH